MKRLLPQADSLEKVILVFAFSYTNPGCSQADIADFLHFKNNKTRQSAYYLNACFYLGLVNENGLSTSIGDSIMKTPEKINESVYELVMTDYYCGKVISRMLINPQDDINKFTMNLLLKDYQGQYKESTIQRRAKTIISWCSEVRNYILGH